MAATLTYQTAASSATDATTYTFTSQAIGTAASDRIVIVGALLSGTTSNSTLSSSSIASIAGATAADACVVGQASQACMFYAAVPTGTTGDISVTASGGKSRAAISVWSAVGSAVAPASTDEQTSAGATSRASVVTVPAGGFVVCMAMHGNTATTGFGWTNATERNDATVENNTRYSGADATASNTITATISASAEIVLVVAVWDVPSVGQPSASRFRNFANSPFRWPQAA